MVSDNFFCSLLIRRQLSAIASLIWFVFLCRFDTVGLGKDDVGKKRKGVSPVPGDKNTSAKKKTPEEKKLQGFDRGLEPEKILGKCVRRTAAADLLCDFRSDLIFFIIVICVQAQPIAVVV